MKDTKQRTILITGSTDGIGKLTALKLAEKSLRIIVHGRNKEKVNNVVAELLKKSAKKTSLGIKS